MHDGAVVLHKVDSGRFHDDTTSGRPATMPHRLEFLSHTVEMVDRRCMCIMSRFEIIIKAWKEPAMFSEL